MVIHIANSVLVYLFVNQITEKLFTEASGKKHISFITALLFLIAPINLEPVAWIAASKVLIYAFFYLLSLIFYVKYIKSVCSKYYYYTLVCFILSFAAKEQALTLPLAMLLLDNLYGREFKRALLWWEKMPPLLLSFLFVLASFQSQGRFVFISTESYELTDRLLLSFYTVSEYFTQILLPVNLCYVYPFPFLPGNSPPMWLWLFPVCIILATYFLRHILLQKHVLFGAGFFFAHIIMVCNLVSLSRHSIVADRYAYIASIGLLWLLCVAGSELLNKARRVQKLYYKGLFAIYIIYFLTYTSVHLWVWQNAVELKQKMRNEIIKRGDYDVQ
ncbi:hypothetical protein LT679_11505 [Mucilaginibacter roseus]|uniref:Uncharacterized protein n=1 Tax=Mucilaginibacter roseus TaxID=1528868 RepID=A0ABS8U544_9SPHI|nr:hypothetical protein [Mucilaginibacter roseus]MCD8741230.1 hypothetical protein [Mucilaginibacter roseus]